MAQGGMVVVKYLLFFFNFVFVVAGIALIAVGAVAKANGNQYLEFLGDKYFSPAVLLIVVGVFVFILSFLGCCGAVKENYCMLMTFSVLLFLIFILELAGGISAYVYRGKLKEIVKDNMENSIQTLNETESEKFPTVWDDVQKSLKCCGIENVTDWEKVPRLNTIPDSCCDDIHVNNCTVEAVLAEHRPGCLQALEDFVHNNITSIGAAGVVIAFIELIGMVFGCCLAYAIKKTYEVV